MAPLRTLFLTTLLLAMALRPAVAQQDRSVSASVDATTVGSDEVVTYSITVEGAPAAEVRTPKPPPTTGLALLQYTPSTQRSSLYTNGTLRQEMTFRWQFRPLRQGTARIGEAEVRVGGETFRTAPIEISVVPQSQRPSRRAPARPPALSGRSAPPPSGSSESGARLDETDLFIRVEADTARALYRGEPITLTYRLFFREGVQVHHSRLAGAWDAPGFWREDLDVSARPVPEPATIDGARYRSIVLKRVAFFPTRTGTLRVDPLVIETEAEASRRRRNPFDRLFSLGRSERVEVASDPVTVEVEPLPEGAPDGFNGAVGSFEMATELEETRVEAGAPVRLVARLTGHGNLATLGAPELTAPDTFAVYGPEAEADLDRGGTEVRGTKTFTYTLVPQASGTFRLRPLTFSYFDPEAGRYKTLRAEPRTIRVTGADEAPLATSLTGAGFPADDLAPPLADAAWTRPLQRPLYLNPWAYAALIVPALLVAGLAAWRRRADHLAAHPALARRRKAHPAAEKRLREARDLLDADRLREAYAAAERAVLGFAHDRLGVSAQGLSRGALDHRLRALGFSEETRRALGAFLDECDRARFAPSAPGRSAAASAMDRAHDLIAALDAAPEPQRSAA